MLGQNRIKIYKYILRDLETMRAVGHTYAAHGEEPLAPKGKFVSKCVDSFLMTEDEYDKLRKETKRNE